MDETNAKLAHEIGELCNTSGERNADVVVTVVRLPPVAVHTPVVELAEVHEIAVRRSQHFFYVFPSRATTLHANGTCCVCINTCALHKIDLPAQEKRKQCN